MHWQMGDVTHAWWPAGAHVSRSLGRRYAVIGTGVGVSDENGIAGPEAGSLEARFAETGLVVTPFLPGDSLLFAAGALATQGGLSVPLMMAILFVAAVLGDAMDRGVKLLANAGAVNPHACAAALEAVARRQACIVGHCRTLSSPKRPRSR
jgi:hypothetical protein